MIFFSVLIAHLTLYAQNCTKFLDITRLHINKYTKQIHHHYNYYYIRRHYIKI